MYNKFVETFPGFQNSFNRLSNELLDYTPPAELVGLALFAFWVVILTTMLISTLTSGGFIFFLSSTATLVYGVRSAFLFFRRIR